MFRADRWMVWIILILCMPAWGGTPTVFCWNNMTNQPGLVAVTEMNCSSAPTLAVSQVAAGFARYPQSERALLLFGCMGNPLVFSAANLQSIVSNGPDCTTEQRYLQMVFTQMKARGLVPARIVLDMESNISTWELEPTNGLISSVLMPVYNNPTSFNRLPASLKQYSPSDFDNYYVKRGWDATVAWNAWQAAVVAQALRQAVSVTATQVFQANIPISNYGDLLPSFTVYDLNNWPIPIAAVGNESSPSIYLTVNGNRYLNLQKDARWNHFIDGLNEVRSAIRNGPVIPWLSYPTYAGDSYVHSGSPWLFKQEVAHLNAMGLTQYFLFNPSTSAQLSDDQYASQVFRSTVTLAKPPAVNYPPIPLDANSVTTGTVTTTYTDFLANLLGGSSAVIK